MLTRFPEAMFQPPDIEKCMIQDKMVFFYWIVHLCQRLGFILRTQRREQLLQTGDFTIKPGHFGMRGSKDVREFLPTCLQELQLLEELVIVGSLRAGSCRDSFCGPLAGDGPLHRETPFGGNILKLFRSERSEQLVFRAQIRD